jgi:hypothetical protein
VQRYDKFLVNYNLEVYLSGLEFYGSLRQDEYNLGVINN